MSRGWIAALDHIPRRTRRVYQPREQIPEGRVLALRDSNCGFEEIQLQLELETGRRFSLSGIRSSLCRARKAGLSCGR